MEIVCWNIRWGQGRDRRVDLARIIETVRGMGDADVICLQEVARHFPEFGGTGADQPVALRDLLPGFEAHYGSSIDVAGEGGAPRRQFGNLILTRLPALQVFSHLLPRPPLAGVRHQQRQALEVVLRTRTGLVRVITTHLEYHSAEHRAAQVERLRALHRQACSHPRTDPAALRVEDNSLLAPAGACPTVLCGDFNMGVSERAYGRLLEPFDEATPALVDAWNVLHPGEEHPPTCGIYEFVHWSAANCRDFFFVSEDLGERVRALDIDLQTGASDHQPLRLVLDV